MALVDQVNLATDSTFQGRVRASLVNYIFNTVMAEASNDAQTITITGSPTGGSFTLSAGPLNAAVAPAWNESAQQVQARIRASLSDGDDCVCTGGPMPGSVVTVVWTGNLAYAPQPKLTAVGSFTGGTSPAVAIGQSVGVAVFRHIDRVAAAKAILASLPSLSDTAVRVAAMIAADATVQSDYTGGGSIQSAVTDAHINSAVVTAFNLFV